MERYPEDTQTLHAELFALLLAQRGRAEWPQLAGTFTTKTIAGTDYVYFAYSDPGSGKRQFAVGRHSPQVERLIDAYRTAREGLVADEQQLRRLAALLRTAGVPAVPHGVARVLRALADAGVFHLGGVLVGSYGFALVGQLLGVAWPEASWRTQDIDVAARLEVAVPRLETDVPLALDSLQMGFVPVPQLDPRHASTSFKVRGKPLRVDLLTPGSDRQTAPVHIARFNAAAAPIKHLDLLLQGAQQAVALDTTPVLVRVPDPARLALHKLLVSQTRSVAQQTKSGKDLHQAALLLEFLAEDRPDDLTAAAPAFANEPVRTRVCRGLAAVRKRHPQAAAGAELVGALLEA